MKLVVPYLWGIETFYCFVTFNHNKCVLYLTYEELKRIYSFNVNNPSNCCTLPMRNWNESPGLLSTILLMFGCTLPMRNWNHCLYWWQEPFWFYTVVPYLWGIETSILRFHSCTSSIVVPYLWGIETGFIITFWAFHIISCCTLPMRNWN